MIIFTGSAVHIANMYRVLILDSIAVSIFVIILVGFDKSETSRLVFLICEVSWFLTKVSP